MVWHLAWKHFKIPLMEKNKLIETSRICPICNGTKTGLQQLINHLAQAHEQLGEFVDSDVLEKLMKKKA
jgi:hypothetical protein